MAGAQCGDNFSVYVPAVLNRPAINPPKGRFGKVIDFETHSLVISGSALHSKQQRKKFKSTLREYQITDSKDVPHALLAQLYQRRSICF
jgi:hypothetical protein